ncbi:hypothetical protein MTP99_018301 [Tenebrio molitor]|uniref:Allatostatin CC n=1 Tax=Tenebrio molitor TaxID=7067 RepID=A0A977XCQ3_TENMO|nr:hypothetical protein MTP99_018301 [Tenebrio molitor]UXO98187.1 allatostatin CC [Tenebrio molitor]CAH1376886.1 unnamed protein product [Tenebrio molitor]
MNRILMLVLESFLVAVLFGSGTDAFVVDRRSAASERNSDDYPDYQLGVKYDEYPMIVPKKRTALLVDRLMVALQQAIEEEEAANRVDGPPLTDSFSLSPEEVRKMDLQRRGHGSMSGQQKGRVYWRCYFNAVTCF